MKIVFISDTHNKLESISVPDGDVLIHCGDMSQLGSEKEIRNFSQTLKRLPHKHKVIIAGNHDFLFEQNKARALALIDGIHYLEDESLVIDGIKMYGTPWQPTFMNWAFNLPRDSQQLSEVWNRVPSDVDILITHGPPYGILDVIPAGQSVGCELLLARVEKLKPRIHCFGHIHPAYGYKKMGRTTFINASICDEAYQPVNRPIVFDWESDQVEG